MEILGLICPQEYVMRLAPLGLGVPYKHFVLTRKLSGKLWYFIGTADIPLARLRLKINILDSVKWKLLEIICIKAEVLEISN